MLRQLSNLLGVLPVWAQVAIALFLVSFSVVTVYGRMNVDFGAKVFSRVPKEEIRTDKGHIFEYTVVPVIVTAGYLILLFARYAA